MPNNATDTTIIGRIRKAIAARDKAQKALDEHDAKRLKKEVNLAMEQASVDALQQGWPEEFALATQPETEPDEASDEGENDADDNLFTTDSDDESDAF